MSILESEIRQQPALLARQLETSLSASADLFRRPEVTHIVLAARGSSDNAARFAQYLIAEHLRIPAYLATPSLFTRELAPEMKNALVIGISQSGQGPDVTAVLDYAKQFRCLTLAITNDLSSPLATVADESIFLNTGPENSVAATKTFSATLFAIARLVAEVGAFDIAPALPKAPALFADVLDRAFASELLLQLPEASPANVPVTTLGRGTSMAIAEEAALKLREVALVRAEAYAVPDLIHGPIAANNAESAAVLFCSPAWPREYWLDLVNRLQQEGVATTAITAEELPGHVLEMRRDLSPWLADLVSIGWAQVAALRLGEAQHLDVDNPKGLTKVTKTY